jgi:hypothetical protein
MATPTALPAAFTAGQVLTAAQQNALRGAFRVLQVVSTAKTNTFTTTSTTFTDITGLTATITPSSTSSKILIFAMVNISSSVSSGDSVSVRLSGGNATTFVGDASSSQVRAALFSNNRTDWGVTHSILPGNIMYLDSPATVSATTYSVQGRANTAGTFVCNYAGNTNSSATFSVVPSSITLMEISA